MMKINKTTIEGGFMCTPISIMKHLNRMVTEPCSCLFALKPPTFRNNKVEYTDNSRLSCLRLEDLFLPGALQNPHIVTFHRTA
jgi:hypothetical protein